MKKKATYKIDGKPTSLKEIRQMSKHDSLRDALGDYISGGEAHKAGIKDTTLQNWRNSGRLRAKKIGATWFYSRQDLLELIRTSKSG